MLKNLLVMMLGLLVTANAFGEINATLNFSTDNGKSWDTDFPLLKKAQEILVKVTWNVEESRAVKGNVVTTLLYSRERDFASATTGKQYWFKGKGAWFQRLKRYYAGVNKPIPFVYRLDLGARKAGVIGNGNKWDNKQRKFVDAPLSACPAFPPGTYRFCISLRYRLKGSNEAVEKLNEFDITIEGDKTSSAVAQDSKKK